MKYTTLKELNTLRNITQDTVNKVTEELNKSFTNGTSADTVEAAFKNLDILIEKSGNHKYFKREGSPGNYKYYYTKEEYDKAHGKKETIKISSAYGDSKFSTRERAINPSGTMTKPENYSVLAMKDGGFVRTTNKRASQFESSGQGKIIGKFDPNQNFRSSEQRISPVSEKKIQYILKYQNDIEGIEDMGSRDWPVDAEFLQSLNDEEINELHNEFKELEDADADRYNEEYVRHGRAEKSINDSLNILKGDDTDIEKGRKDPIGTVRNGRKKVAEGKWVAEKKGGEKKEDNSAFKNMNHGVVNAKGVEIGVSYTDSKNREVKVIGQDWRNNKWDIVVEDKETGQYYRTTRKAVLDGTQSDEEKDATQSRKNEMESQRVLTNEVIAHLENEHGIKPSFVDRMSGNYRIKLGDNEEVAKKVAKKFPGAEAKLAGMPKVWVIKVPFSDSKEVKKSTQEYTEKAENLAELRGELEEFYKAVPIGTVNKHGKIKTAEGWVYQKKGMGANGGKTSTHEEQVAEKKAIRKELKQHLNKLYDTGVTGQKMRITRVDVMNTSIQLQGVDAKLIRIPNKEALSRLKSAIKVSGSGKEGSSAGGDIKSMKKKLSELDGKIKAEKDYHKKLLSDNSPSGRSTINPSKLNKLVSERNALKKQIREKEEGGPVGDGPKLSTKEENYSWGRLITVAKGNGWAAILHPEHQRSIQKLGEGESYNFEDEQGKNWKVTATSEKGKYNLQGTDSRTETYKGHFEMSEVKDWTLREILNDRSTDGGRDLMDRIDEYRGDLEDQPGREEHMDGLRDAVKELKDRFGYEYDISEQEEAYKKAQLANKKK